MRLYCLRGFFSIISAMSVIVWGVCTAEEDIVDKPVPENLYIGELVRYPGPWAFQLGRSSIILVSDQELETLAGDPEAVLNLSLGYQPYNVSLRQVCESARACGNRTLILAFDHFFSQYRPGQTEPRKLTPDMDEYVGLVARISKFAEGYGLGLELSLLSPLEVGPAYRKETGESGVWMHYRKGLRDPKTGAYSVQLWKQNRWANNKGAVDLEDAGVRVFAFCEEPVWGTPYSVVRPESIVEISDDAMVEGFEGLVSGGGDYTAQRVRIYGKGRTDIGELDKVLVVQQYRTPEMDYFSENALPFLKGLVDKYVEAGVKLNGLYSDEMHIQQDWHYFAHHEHGEFAMRYVSPGLEAEYARRYGAEFGDFAKYLIYFCYGQEDTSNSVNAKSGTMAVFGSSPEEIRRTALFRARYYRLLQNGVVDLFTQAKLYAERRMGHKLESRAHATWAESPTIDKWETGRENMYRYAYEYTSNFIWSNTVHQAAAACYDYFKWGDFLTGNGNDHCECGWLDRNYVGLALACSTGIINEVPYSYAAHWGMPAEVAHRRSQVQSVFGAAGSPLFGIVQDMQHRDVNVLMLYPIDLVAVEERFGSWMTQYGYANLITQDKLSEMGKVKDGAIELGGRRFDTLVALFEPFPSKGLLDMMKRFIQGGGRLVWSGPPPVLTSEGGAALHVWQDIFGVEYSPDADEGQRAPGRQIVFEGALSNVPPQTILTDFIVDRIYPVMPRSGIAVVASVKGQTVGTERVYPGGGRAVFLGFRPRDDQSQSLGYDERHLFEILSALGAYPPTGKFGGINDNTEHLSRTGEYLVCRFPNGCVAVSPHLKLVEEGWHGGFSRNAEEDRAWLEKNPVPSNALVLDDAKMNGHSVTYKGEGAMAFRLNDTGELIAFCGSKSREITVDGRTFVFAEAPVNQVSWAPIPEKRRVDNGAILQIMAYGSGILRIPIGWIRDELELVLEGDKPGSKGAAIPSVRDGDALVFEVGDKESGRWIYGVPAK